VAVVSISRIQIRRGRKNEGSGLPQLASGELGWATDAQELWIGNGAVSEGSPFVGNTKVLSEHDDLFAYAKTYAYASTSNNYQTGVSVNTPTQRTLQQRLDDRVSIRSFGANGDGLDQTVQIQRAIDQLYLNAATKLTAQSRVVLYMEPGTYKISDTIHLPPYCTLQGAGKDKTIINCTSSTATAFDTVNDSSTPDNPANDSTSTTLNQARNIFISDLTIQVATNQALKLQSCKDSTFENIKLKGPWQDSSSSGATTGIWMRALSTAVNCQGNYFNNVTIHGFTNGIKSDHDISKNIWNNCRWNTCFIGVDFGSATSLGNSGMLTGPVNNIITNSHFDNIGQGAIEIATGSNNVSQLNKFYNVGNSMGSSAIASHPILKYTAFRNQSIDDWFKRTEELGYDPAYQVNIPYIPEISGSAIAQIGTTYRLAITQFTEYSKLFRLPADTTRSFEIDYIYKSSAVNAQRSGKMEIIVRPSSNLVDMADTFDYIGDAGLAENLKFKAQTFDENSNSEVDTIAIMVLNSTSSDNAELTYTVRSKS
jgi:hypothetical protein|tara:strand:- start:2660 stop:4276 length:1617 start_codon:yes stop_codon:yes gene_type:complete